MKLYQLEYYRELRLASVEDTVHKIECLKNMM